MRLRTLGRWLLLLALWTLLGVFFATQTFIGASYGGRGGMGWAQALTVALTAWYLRAAFSPIPFWLGRRFPIAGSASRGRHLLIHVPASLLLAAAQQALFEAILSQASWVPRRALSPVELHMSVLTYWVVVGIAHALDYYHRYRDRALAASRLEAKLSEARLDLLRMQLHPHFLFNTLHAISELMHEDVERADLMLTNLSDLLRLALDSRAAREVPVRQEIAFLERYLAIQQIRFQDRLSVDFDVDADVLDARVPYLILQPLVENAVRHGIASRRGAGRIQVRAQPVPQDGIDGTTRRLRLEVIDDGPGMGPDGMARSGLGLANTRERLEATYGGEHRLDLIEGPGGGLRVVLEIPLQVAPEAASRVEPESYVAMPPIRHETDPSGV